MCGFLLALLASKGITGVGIGIGIERTAMTFDSYGYAVCEPSLEYSKHRFDSDSEPDAEV